MHVSEILGESMKTFFRALNPRHWAWVHVIIAAGIWWPAFLLSSPPEFLEWNLDHTVLALSMGTAILGAVLMVFGFLCSQQTGKPGVLGVSIELVGIILASVGPVVYLVAYTYLLILDADDVNFGSAFVLAYTICALYLYRATIVVPRFRKEAHDDSKE